MILNQTNQMKTQKRKKNVTILINKRGVVFRKVEELH